MKIAAYLTRKVDSGGGFNQSLNAILQMKAIAEHRFELVVVTTVQDNIQYLEHWGVHVDYVKPAVTDKLTVFLALSGLGRKIQSKLKVIGVLEQFLLQQQVDLVYFLEPTLKVLCLQKLNYIITVWDLCHRDTPEFPEVRSWNEFLTRETIYHHCLAQALLVLADSDTLVDRLVERYGVDRDRVITMPFSPSPFLEDRASNNVDVLQKYNLSDGYFFYPAQFWAHKNHIRILQALQLLKKQGKEYNVVFCGSDQGSAGHIKQAIHDHGLSGQVKVLGFVPVEDMRNLYQHCCAVVMPSYFGPTNIPPLEAWMLGKPLIYSDIFTEQVGDAALLVNPDDANELASAMERIGESNELCATLVERGGSRLKEIEAARKNADVEILACLQRFEKRRQCWL